MPGQRHFSGVTQLLYEHQTLTEALRRIVHLPHTTLDEPLKSEAAVSMAKATLYQLDIPLSLETEDSDVHAE